MPLQSFWRVCAASFSSASGRPTGLANCRRCGHDTVRECDGCGNDRIAPPDGTTSQSTDETTSHPTKQPKNGCQVVGYKPASWQVAGYPAICRLCRNQRLGARFLRA